MTTSVAKAGKLNLTMSSAKKDFFISYTAADRAWADWIAWQLRDAGFTTVHQSWDFRPGDNFVSKIKNAFQDCDRTITIYSAQYFQSRWTEDEWTAAFAARKFLPVRVQKCEIPDFLRTRVYIDLLDLNEQAAREALLDGLRRESITPKEAPAFPPNQSKPKRFPGSPPPIWNLAPRNPHFTGRADLLTAVHDLLQSGRPAALTQAISGLGGVGKTQTALEYAHRYASDYETIWWLHAEDPGSLATDYAALAVLLNLREKDLANQHEIVAAVRRHLEHTAGWLLIFDNAEKPESVTPYLPSGNTGHILITSRNQSWSKIAQQQTVREFPREESIAFLKQRTGRDQPESNDLAQELGDLPLALEQAAAYIEENGIAIRDYLKLFRDYPREMLEPYEKTWAISIDRLREENPTAIDLLNLIAFLAPDDIPRDLLHKTAQNPLKFNKSVADLRRYALIEAGPEFINVHRLVQKVTHHRTNERKWAKKALNVVYDAFPADPTDYRNWPTCAKLITHAVEVSNHAGNLEIEPKKLSRLLNDAGLYERERARFQSAEEHLKRSLEIAEKAYGPETPEVAIHCNNLGQILQDQGNRDAAFQFAKRALEINEKVFGLDHPEVAINCNNLGTILKDQGDLDAAFQYTKRALEIDEKVFGPDHPDAAIDCNNLGQILQAQGNLDTALKYAKRALKIHKKVFGANHPSVAIDCDNLGAILRDQGNLDAALKYAKRALEIYEKAFGPDHPDVATNCNNLGLILRDQGNLDAALPYFQRTLRILQSFFGPDHSRTKTVAQNLRNLQSQIAARPPSPKTPA
jgi:tetratricopeptide (TPR) repeat protein